MSHKEDALQEIVTIARNNQLTLDDISKALAEKPGAAASSSLLSKIFSYLGGILIFSGICIYIGMNWGQIPPAGRVIITLGTGFMLFIMAIVVLADKRYERAATPLLLMSSLIQPTGIFVMLEEYGHGGDPRLGVMFMACDMLIQQAAAFWSKRLTTLALTSIFFGSVLFCTFCDYAGMNEKLIGTVLGASLICIAYALANSRHASLSSFWYFIGAASLLISVFNAVEHTSYEVVYLGIAAFMVFLSTFVRSRALLTVSTLAMIGYIGYYTSEHVKNDDWAIALILGGLLMIGLGAAAVKINNKYIKQQG